MTERVRYRPFTGDETLKVRLSAAPLELVLCQVRWPEFAFLQGDITGIANVLSGELGDYPLYSSSPEMSFAISPEGVQATQVGTLFQWRSLDGVWHVTFGKRYAALYCTRYTDYSDFNDRLARLLDAVRRAVGIPQFDRVGVRYVNRIADAEVIQRIGELVRPEVMGYQALPLGSDEVALVRGINQAMFSVGDSNLQVRSGLVPPGETVDAAVPPLEVPTWVLDLDAYIEVDGEFDIEAIKGRASQLSDTAYDFFKLVISKGFIEQFGGGDVVSAG